MHATAPPPASATGARPTVCVVGDPTLSDSVSDIASRLGFNRRAFPTIDALQHVHAVPSGPAPTRPACVVIEHEAIVADQSASLTAPGPDSDAMPLVVLCERSAASAALASLSGPGVIVVDRSASPDALGDAIHAAVEFDRTRSQVRKRFATLDASVTSLTARERTILDSIVAGELNKSIAESLSVSVRTVEGDRARIVEKFSASTTSEVVGAYAEHQLMERLGYTR